MNNTIRVGLLAMASVLPVLQAWAQGDVFPDRRVTLVVPFSAGGAGDQLARVLANELSAEWKQPVLVENKPGANGILATQAVTRARPDGYTLLLHNTTLVQVLSLMKNPGYEPFSQLDVVAHIGNQPIAIAVSARSRYKTIAQLTEGVRSGQVQAYGSFGTGSTGHIYGEQFRSQLDSGMTHVPYKGESPMMTDLIPDRIPFGWISGATARGTAKDNTIRILAVTGPTRIPELKDAPTLSEAGVKGFEVIGWWGLFAPAGTPEITRAKIAAQVQRILGKEDFRTILNQQVITPPRLDPKAFSAEMKRDSQWWGSVISKYDIRID